MARSNFWGKTKLKGTQIDLLRYSCCAILTIKMSWLQPNSGEAGSRFVVEANIKALMSKSNGGIQIGIEANTSGLFYIGSHMNN